MGGDRPVNPIHGLKFLEGETDFAFEGILPLNLKAVRRMKNINDMVLKEISFYQAKNLWSILLCSN